MVTGQNRGVVIRSETAARGEGPTRKVMITIPAKKWAEEIVG